MIGATELSEALKTVEFAARNGELDRADARMDDIRSGFRAIRAYLDTLAPVFMLIARPMAGSPFTR